MAEDSGIRKSDWKLIAVSVAVGSLITVTYDMLKPCFIGLFQNSHSFTCNSDSSATALAWIVSFFVGFGYLLLFRLSERKKKKPNSTPDS